jgi:hypothetical protein
MEFSEVLSSIWSGITEGKPHPLPMIDLNLAIQGTDEFNFKAKLPPSFGNWLKVCDEFLVWHANAAMYITMLLQTVEIPNNDEIIALFALQSAIVQQIISIRRLVLSGLDVPAKQILRCLDEHVQVAIAVTNDTQFATDFVKCEGIEGAKKFWSLYLRRKQNESVVGYNIIAKLRSIFGDQELVNILAFDQEEQAILNAAVHPSHVGCVMSGLSTDEEVFNWVPFLGTVSSFSIRTMKYCVYKVSLHTAVSVFGPHFSNFPSSDLFSNSANYQDFEKVARPLFSYLVPGRLAILNLAQYAFGKQDAEAFRFDMPPSFADQ